MKVGYLRSISAAQDVAALLAILESHGCQQIFTGSPMVPSHKDGTLATLLRRLKKGDTLIVARFTCVADSLPQLVALGTELGRRGVSFESIEEKFSTAGASGDTALATFELLHRFGLELQKHWADGGGPIRPRSGRPRALTEAEAQRAHFLVFDQGQTVERVARDLGVSRATLYRYLEEVKGFADPSGRGLERLA